MDRKLILSSPNMHAIASQVAAASGAAMGEIRWDAFEAGWPDQVVSDDTLDRMRGTDLYYFGSLRTPGDAVFDLGVLYALWAFDAARVNYVLPFFPTATNERPDHRGRIMTAKTVARMISVIPAADARSRAFIFDPHTEDLPNFFGDAGARPKMLTMVDDMKAHIDPSTYAIAFPDLGALKRFGKSFAGYRQVICEKERLGGDKRNVTVIEGDPRGLDLVIFDDIGNTCGTMLACRETLMRAGASSVRAAFIHAPLPHRSWARLTPELFPEVFVTDSCPETLAEIGDRCPHFRVVPIHRRLTKLVREGF